MPHVCSYLEGRVGPTEGRKVAAYPSAAIQHKMPQKSGELGPVLRPSPASADFDSAAIGGPVVEAPTAPGQRWRTFM